MKLFENTRQTLSDVPKIHSILTFRGFGFEIARVASLSLLYVAALKGAPYLLESHPLVLAWVATNLIFLSNIIREEFPKHFETKGAVAAMISFAVVMFFFFFWINDPLWVKRAVSFFAAMKLLFFLISVSQIERIRARNPSWDADLFVKGQMFQGPGALVVLVVNEFAIWTGDDWLWIASRALLVLLIPLVYAIVASAIRR